MTRERTSSSGGIGCTEALQLIFIVLKLIGVIDWSWWWVLSPTLILLSIIAIVLVLAVLVKGKG